MKFKNQDGTEFSSIRAALGDYCRSMACYRCPMKRMNKGPLSCKDWAAENKEETARLIGLEVIREEGVDFPAPEYDPKDVALQNDVTDTNVGNKPLAEWTLAELKKFCSGRDCEGCCFRKEPDSTHIICPFRKCAPSGWELDPRPRFTEEEVAFARYFAECYNAPIEGCCIKRPVDTQLIVKWEGKHVFLPVKLFPTIKTDESVMLSDIIGEPEV